MNELPFIIALCGWLLAVIQLIVSHRESKLRNEEKLLEQTLGYFERGTQARSIGISLVDGIWWHRKKHLDIIVPVLVSQLVFLLRDAEDFGQESRNLIRLLFILEKCLPYARDAETEKYEILDALLVTASSPGKIITTQTLRRWYEKFGGDLKIFDAEIQL